MGMSCAPESGPSELGNTLQGRAEVTIKVKGKGDLRQQHLR